MNYLIIRDERHSKIERRGAHNSPFQFSITDLQMREERGRGRCKGEVRGGRGKRMFWRCAVQCEQKVSQSEKRVSSPSPLRLFTRHYHYHYDASDDDDAMSER